MRRRPSQPASSISRFTFDAGATMPTLSPGRSARGLIREFGEAEGISVFVGHARFDAQCSILNEELAAADESCWTSQINLILPSHRLRSSRRDHLHWRSDAPPRYRSHRRRARSRARGLRLSHAPFKQPDFNFTRTAHHATFYVPT